LHVGDNGDKGGNRTQVRWVDRGSNMHRVWDSGIIERAGTTEEFWLNDLADLDTAENRAARMSYPSLCLTVVVERSQSARTTREICPLG
jgi:hypothetical protein